MCVQWPDDLYATGRLQFCTTFLHSMWVSGAVCYGYPEGRLHACAKERTEQTLSFGFSRLMEHQGPRYFCGDWNFEPSQLQIPDLLTAAGWIEIQDLYQMMTGQTPTWTCKGVSRKDVMWISPELRQWFTGLSIDSTVFPDHVVLLAHFCSGPCALDRFLWPRPLPVDWTCVPPMGLPVDFAVDNPSQQYGLLWRHRETQAQASCHPWSRKQGGRASQVQPRKRVGWVSPIKQGRSSDFQPRFFGNDTQHSRWIRQLRRIHNYVRWSANRPHSRSVDHHIHGCQLWESILSASGFVPSFANWWPQRSLVCFGDPERIPTVPPAHDVAELILVAFHHEVRQYERTLQQARRQHAVDDHAANPLLIFRDVKRPRPEPVTTLIQPTQAQVTEVDSAGLSLILDRPVTLRDDCPVFVDGKPLEVIHADSDQVWVENVDSIQPQTMLVQRKFLGSLPEVFNAFREQWNQRWCRHDNLPHTHWNEIVGFAKQFLGFQPVPHVPLDADMIVAEATRKKSYAATGLDGVSRHDVIHACPATLISLVIACLPVLNVMANGQSKWLPAV